jgi:hypothetical protein
MKYDKNVLITTLDQIIKANDLESIKLGEDIAKKAMVITLEYIKLLAF